MPNKNKVKIMNKLALYDGTLGPRYNRISEYPKKSYLSTNRLITFLTITLGYGLLFLIFAVFYGEKLINSLDFSGIIFAGFLIIVLYFVLLITYLIITNIIYKQRHYDATMATKQYYRDIKKLIREIKREHDKKLNLQDLELLREMIGETNE